MLLQQTKRASRLKIQVSSKTACVQQKEKKDNRKFHRGGSQANGEEVCFRKQHRNRNASRLTGDSGSKDRGDQEEKRERKGERVFSIEQEDVKNTREEGQVRSKGVLSGAETKKNPPSVSKKAKYFETEKTGTFTQEAAGKD